MGVDISLVARARTHIGDRGALFRALAEAVRPDSPSSVLVLVGFEGLGEYLRSTDLDAGDALIRLLGEQLIEATDGAGALFASRRGEFCLLCEGGLAAVRSTVVMLPPLLDEVAASHGLRTSLGIALLPDEATLPTYALALADRRIRALSGEIRATVR